VAKVPRGGNEPAKNLPDGNVSRQSKGKILAKVERRIKM
jgi:hypothetical protein